MENLTVAKLAEKSAGKAFVKVGQVMLPKQRVTLNRTWFETMLESSHIAGNAAELGIPEGLNIPVMNDATFVAYESLLTGQTAVSDLVFCRIFKRKWYLLAQLMTAIQQNAFAVPESEESMSIFLLWHYEAGSARSVDILRFAFDRKVQKWRLSKCDDAKEWEAGDCFMFAK